MCQIAGVGEVGAEEPRPEAVAGALNDVRSGAAFQESPYSDYARSPRQGGGMATS